MVQGSISRKAVGYKQDTEIKYKNLCHLVFQTNRQITSLMIVNLRPDLGLSLPSL